MTGSGVAALGLTSVAAAADPAWIHGLHRRGARGARATSRGGGYYARKGRLPVSPEEACVHAHRLEACATAGGGDGPARLTAGITALSRDYGWRGSSWFGGFFPLGG